MVPLQSPFIMGLLTVRQNAHCRQQTVGSGMTSLAPRRPVSLHTEGIGSASEAPTATGRDGRPGCLVLGYSKFHSGGSHTFHRKVDFGFSGFPLGSVHLDSIGDRQVVKAPPGQLCSYVPGAFAMNGVPAPSPKPQPHLSTPSLKSLTAHC